MIMKKLSFTCLGILLSVCTSCSNSVTHPGIAHESDQKEYDSISHFNLSSNPINCSNSSSVAKGIVILPFPFSLQVNWTFVLK